MPDRQVFPYEKLMPCPGARRPILLPASFPTWVDIIIIASYESFGVHHLSGISPVSGMISPVSGNYPLEVFRRSDWIRLE